MLKSGIYRHRHQTSYADGTVVEHGNILLDVHETKSSYVLTLLEQQVRYDAPQIDDLFRKANRVVIKKNGSQHGMSVCNGIDDWFCLYPYRVGVPYSFEYEGQKLSKTEIKRKTEEDNEMSNTKQNAKKEPVKAPQEDQGKARPTEIGVRAYPIGGDGSVLANLTFDINGCFAIRGAKLIQGKNGPFVSMPQRKVGDEYREVVFPITKEMRDQVNSMALDAYQLALAEMQEKLGQTQKNAAAPAQEMTMG